MSKIYLVDSENIGASWSQLLQSMSREDRMFVFYTEKSPYISYDNLLQVLAYCDIPVFIKCHEGKNALDFQLVSELGYKLCQDPEAEFIIVSDDYGYDAAVRYWKERMYNVHRIGKKYCRPMAVKKTEESAAVQTEAEETESVPEVSLESQVQPEEGTNVFEGNVALRDNKQPVEEVKEQEVGELTAAEKAAAEQLPGEEADKKQVAEEKSAGEQQVEEKSIVEQLTVQEITEQVTPEQPTSEQSVKEQVIAEKEAGQQENEPQEDRQQQSEASLTHTQKRNRNNRRKSKKEQAELPAHTQKEGVPEENAESPSEKEDGQDALSTLLLEITRKCNSPEPQKDADSVREVFCCVPMSNLTVVNTALKILIGNELGNDIYRELKERQECKAQLDALYFPDMKSRFMKYVDTVLKRSNLDGVGAEEIGGFLLDIPRKNLNSIRAAIMKEYGNAKGSSIYTVFKPHIIVLNKI